MFTLALPKMTSTAPPVRQMPPATAPVAANTAPAVEASGLALPGMSTTAPATVPAVSPSNEVEITRIAAKASPGLIQSSKRPKKVSKTKVSRATIPAQPAPVKTAAQIAEDKHWKHLRREANKKTRLQNQERLRQAAERDELEITGSRQVNSQQTGLPTPPTSRPATSSASSASTEGNDVNNTPLLRERQVALEKWNKFASRPDNGFAPLPKGWIQSEEALAWGTTSISNSETVFAPIPGASTSSLGTLEPYGDNNKIIDAERQAVSAALGQYVRRTIHAPISGASANTPVIVEDDDDDNMIIDSETQDAPSLSTLAAPEQEASTTGPTPISGSRASSPVTVEEDSDDELLFVSERPATPMADSTTTTQQPARLSPPAAAAPAVQQEETRLSASAAAKQMKKQPYLRHMPGATSAFLAGRWKPCELHDEPLCEKCMK